MTKGHLRSGITAAFDQELWQALQILPAGTQYTVDPDVKLNLMLGVKKDSQGSPGTPAAITAEKDADGNIVLLVKIVNRTWLTEPEIIVLGDAHWLKLTSPTIAFHPHQDVKLNSSPQFNLVTGNQLNFNILDLGTNRISDGAMSGNWNFGSGNLITTGEIRSETGFSLGINHPTPNFPLRLQASNSGQFSATVRNTGVFAGSVARWRLFNDASFQFIVELFSSTSSNTFMGINTADMGVLRASSGALMILTRAVDKDMFFGAGNALAITIDGTTQDITLEKDIAGNGFAVKLENNTGANSIQGEVVIASTTTDNAVNLAAANELMAIGIFKESGIANGSPAKIVWGGKTKVRMNAAGCSRGDRIVTSATAGRGETNNLPTVAGHFQEIGHALEDAGANATANCMLHFL